MNLIEENKEAAKLTNKLYEFQNELETLTKKIKQNPKIKKDELKKILKFYGILDDFVLNIKGLNEEFGEFYSTEIDTLMG